MSKEIPESLRPLWGDLQSEVTWLHGRWIIYRQLFGTNEKRIALLNETAGTFFYAIQHIMLDDMALSLSRLTDPFQTRQQENLVLEQLVRHAEILAHPDLATRLEKRLKDLRQKCEPFRRIRNKRIAHRDLRTALKVEPEPLPGVSRQMVEEALAGVRRLLNDIEIFFTQSETAYQLFIMTDDGEALIAALKKAVAYDKAEREDLIDWRFFESIEYAYA